MSHQTGIVASDDLKRHLASGRDGSFRLIKASISSGASPEIEANESRQGTAAGNWEDDWDKLLLAMVDSDQPAYFLYRLDEKADDSGYLWVFISWSPDSATTRQKMLYASTKATFKKEFGQGQIKDEYFATCKEEMTLDGYKRHLISSSGPGPLSKEEEEMKEIKQSETRVDIGVDTKQQTMTSLSFPLEQSALAALEEFKNHGSDYVQLSIDISNESIKLKDKGLYSVEELAGLIPDDCARYHLFRFKHIYENEPIESLVFIYSMPGYSVSIKERMLYSSCKNAVVNLIENQYQINITKKIEVQTGNELSEDNLMAEVHPVEINSKPKFSKPAPPSRGRRRITKAPTS